METRALAIAFFYAVGTAVGGITGPLLFGHLIESGSRNEVIIAFLIGAGVMAIGGIAELLFGVKAEQAELEDIAQPLTAEEAEEGEAARRGRPRGRAAEARRRGRRAGRRAPPSRERERRIADRAARRQAKARTGLRRFRPGPGSSMAGRGMSLVGDGAGEERALDREIEAIARALDEHGPTRRDELARDRRRPLLGPGPFPGRGSRSGRRGARPAPLAHDPGATRSDDDEEGER